MGVELEITSLQLSDLMNSCSITVNDLIPVVAALRFNNYFETLIIDGNVTGDLWSVICSVFKQSLWLKRIVIHNCYLSHKISHDIVASLSSNKGMPLRAIDFSLIDLGSA
uniref:Uncharacterized protein n=1 Tax=Plectus sambesii TaxID=2011161 RepID=A0A914VUH8_9BILA